MPASKLTRQLRDSLSGRAPGAMIDVIVELEVAPAAPTQGEPRGEKIARQRQQFMNAASQVEQRIETLGGTVLDRAWINQTLRARVPVDTLERIVDVDGVMSIDVPAQLSRD